MAHLWEIDVFVFGKSVGFRVVFFIFFEDLLCLLFKFMDETVNYGTLRYSSSNIFSKRFLVIKPLAKRWILRTALINLASMFEFKKPKNLI